MADNVFNAAGTACLGPQPFAFNRAAMLAGTAATFVSTGITVGANEPVYLPADLDGCDPAARGRARTRSSSGPAPASTRSTTSTSTSPRRPTRRSRCSPARRPPAFTALCAATRACVPEPGTARTWTASATASCSAPPTATSAGYESLVANYTVNSSGVAGDSLVRAAQRDQRAGDARPGEHLPARHHLALDGQRGAGPAGRHGASASAPRSATINPQIRYAGRLATDPANTLAQGEATLFAGTGARAGTGNRWGDYSDMTVDPTDDCTFWYTKEYYSTHSDAHWRTRIGKFKFPQCPRADADRARSRATARARSRQARPASAAARRAPSVRERDLGVPAPGRRERARSSAASRATARARAARSR